MKTQTRESHSRTAHSLVDRPLDDRLADTSPAPADSQADAPRRDDAGIDARSIYDAYRRQIEHEDNLLAGRSSWLLLAQSFLVVAYSILHQLAPPDPRVQPVTALLTQALSVLGIVTALPILLSILAASDAMRSLRTRFAGLAASRADLQALLVVYPALQIGGRDLRWGRSPAIALPAAFIVFWGTLLVATILT